MNEPPGPSSMQRTGIRLIHAYRSTARRINYRPVCLFRESCSHCVERVLVEEGVGSALRAARRRFSLCRPGYRFERRGESWVMVLRNGAEVSPELVSEQMTREAGAALGMI